MAIPDASIPFFFLGHAFGLPHTDEDYYNEDLGDCLDYTINPRANMQPGQYNFNLLAQMYGTIRNRRMLRKGAKNTFERTEELILPPTYQPTSEKTKAKDGAKPTPNSAKEQIKDNEEPKEMPTHVQILYTDFVTALETISGDEWNKSNPDKRQATQVEGNDLGEVCELELGEDYLVQVRKLIYFKDWDQLKD